MEKEEFNKKNKVTLNLSKKIGSYLKTWELPSIPIIVNCLTPFIKKTQQFQNNSNFIIDNMGMGKTTILDILQKSNPKHLKILPKKMYAMDLADLGDDYYKNCILVHQDMVGAFGGLKPKTLEQLSGFWTSLLSEHHYEQLGKKIKNANCCVMFPITKYGWYKNKHTFIDETFTDRVTQLIVEARTEEEIKEIADFKLNREELIYQKYPKIKLPFPARQHKIEWSKQFHENFRKEIINLAFELEEFRVCSITRGTNYIRNFLKANALINNRKEVNEYDLELYKSIHKLHKGTFLTMLQKVKYALEEQLKTDVTDKELIRKYKFTKPTFYKYKKQIEEMG